HPPSHLHPFPTRRSSDLLNLRRARRGHDFYLTSVAAYYSPHPACEATRDGGVSERRTTRTSGRRTTQMSGRQLKLTIAEALRERSEEHTSELQSRSDLVC